MNPYKKKILIVGLFLSEKNRKKILRTAADQLAELLRKSNFDIITVSAVVNQAARLLDTLATILFRSFSYEIAILPMYGGGRSYIWESASARLLKLLRKKIVLIVHGGSLPYKMKQNPEKYLSMLRRADVVVCPSDFLRKVLREYGVESMLIENVVNLGDYSPQHKQQFRPHIFWMRTLEDVYNPEMAVRVGALLARKYSDFKMVMAGYDRGSMQMVKALAQRLNILDRIEFPGYITNEQKNRYAEEFDIYICTNRIDNAPVSLIEMMAQGIPIVTVNSGGIPYLVKDGFNGLMVELDDDAAMAERISAIIEQPELGQKLVQNGLIFSKQFGEQPVLEKWKNLFAQLEETSTSLPVKVRKTQADRVMSS